MPVPVPPWRRSRFRRLVTLALGASLAALAVPALANAAANPLTLDYSNSTDIGAYARPTGAVIVGRNFFNPGVVDRIQNGGGEVYQYINPVEGYWTNQTATGEQAALYGGGQTNPAYLMKPAVYNYPDVPMTDMRPGSPWILHAVDHLKQWFPTTHAKGLFLDEVGERLYTSAWDSLNASQQAAWSAGNRDLVHRLRAALGPNVIIVANNIWETGNPELNGIMVEHHPFSENARWASMLQRSDWFKPTRNMVIGTSTSEALSWAGRPGVTHVSAQSDYDGPAPPIVGFSALPGVSGVVPPTRPASAPAAADAAPSAPAPATKALVMLQGNLLTNPSFERVLSPWASSRGKLRIRTIKDAPQGNTVAQIAFTGGAAKYAIVRSAATGASADTGGRYAARGWVRAGSRNAVGKPVTVYLREISTSGALVQQIRGRTVKLARKSFVPVGGSIIPKVRGDRIALAFVQDRARTGNSFQLDAVTVAPVS